MLESFEKGWKEQDGKAFRDREGFKPVFLLIDLILGFYASYLLITNDPEFSTSPRKAILVVIIGYVIWSMWLRMKKK